MYDFDNEAHKLFASLQVDPRIEEKKYDTHNALYRDPRTGREEQKHLVKFRMSWKMLVILIITHMAITVFVDQ